MVESEKRKAEKRKVDEPGLSLRLEESKDVVLSDGSLDVSDDGSRSVVDELDSDLGDSSSGTGSTKDLDDFGELDGLLGRRGILHRKKKKMKKMKRVSTMVEGGCCRAEGEGREIGFMLNGPC